MDKKRIATLALGQTGNHSMNMAINWVLDPLVVLLLNRNIGGMRGFALTWVLLAAMSFFVCYLLLLFYDWSKKDWLGIEAVKTLKTLKELEGSSFKRMIAKIIQRGDAFAVIALSIIFDPFIVIAYVRHGANQYNGLTKKDWKIFFISILISNGWETVILYGGLEGIKQVFKMII